MRPSIHTLLLDGVDISVCNTVEVFGFSRLKLLQEGRALRICHESSGNVIRKSYVIIGIS